jgi:hypothetical protein
MRTLGKIFLAITVFWLWMGFARTFYYCQIKGQCGDTYINQDSVFLSKLPKTLHVFTDELVVLEGYHEFYFEKDADTSKILKAHAQFLEQLAAMLKSQPASRLLISAAYRDGEKSESAEKRARFISENLIKNFGISEGQLFSETLNISDSSGFGLIKFELLGFIPNGELLQQREEALFRTQWQDSMLRVSYNGLLGIFEPEATDFKQSPAFIEYSDSLLKFLHANPKAKLKITGHSDTHLEDSEAEKVAKHYAEIIKIYLVKAGIKNRITVHSSGKKEAIHRDVLPDNSPNVLALAKNRRVEIVIVLATEKSRKKNK